MDNLDITPEVRQLFLDVFVKEPSNRPLAFDLLMRPIISSAEEYAIYFDECYDSEDSEELYSALTQIADYSNVEQEVPEISHISFISSDHLTEDKVGELPCFPNSQNLRTSDRGSHDSGVGTDSERSFSERSSVVDEQRLYQDPKLEDMTGSQQKRSGEFKLIIM